MIYCQMTNISFAEWLQEIMDDREIKSADLARLAHLDPGVITRILKAEREATPKTLTAIAHGLKLPPDYVFEKAGILPPKPELNSLQRELLYASQGMPESDIRMALQILETRAEYYAKHPEAKPKTE